MREWHHASDANERCKGIAIAFVMCCFRFSALRFRPPSLASCTTMQSVTLGDEEARRRGVQKSILERAAPPTFDVAIEMIERGKWKVHLDVSQAVDALLAGGSPGGQVRGHGQ